MEVLVRGVHVRNSASDRRIVVALTGGGTSGLATLLAVAGASATLLAADVPYSREALRLCLGSARAQLISSYASREAAIALAGASLDRAKKLTTRQTSGVGVAAALAAEPQRRGKHVIFASLVDDARCIVTSVQLVKGRRSRHDEDSIAGAALIAAVTQASHATSGPSADEQFFAAVHASGAPPLGDDEPVRHAVTVLPAPLVRLLHPPSDVRASAAASNSDDTAASTDFPALPYAVISPLLGDVSHVLYVPSRFRCVDTAQGVETTRAAAFSPLVNGFPASWSDEADCARGVSADQLPRCVLICPGSFNPLHEGHLAMAAAAADVLDAERGADDTFVMRQSKCDDSSNKRRCLVVFELSATNVDKPALDVEEIERRVSQFSTSLKTASSDTLPCAIVVTKAPRFIDKARLFPGAAFVIGADTARRLVQPRYYGAGGEAAVLTALLPLKAAGTRFVVAGRLIDGVFVTLSDLLPEIPEALHSMFILVPESSFRIDISSTQLRQTAAGLPHK